MVDTHTRILDAGARLFRRQGYTGTGMKAIVAESGAPLGSIYHFFPGGKDELTAEVVRLGAQTYGELIPFFFDNTPHSSCQGCCPRTAVARLTWAFKAGTMMFLTTWLSDGRISFMVPKQISELMLAMVMGFRVVRIK